MQRELTIRLSPLSPALEGKIVQLVKQEYKILDVIKQRFGQESYIYLKLESKNANS
jgi:hypothetical protein